MIQHLTQILISNNISIVLLYHATYNTTPPELNEGLHNVAPYVLHQQLEALQKYYTFLSIEEWMDYGGNAKTAAVTFDDAYKCVFSEGLPFLEALDIPATIFVNGCTLLGQTIWRDKIRYLINNSLVDDFLSWLPNSSSAKTIIPGNFYRETKKLVNSKEMANLLDSYFAEKNIITSMHSVDNQKQLIRHPLLSYGNHTFNHYVMSTLTFDQQVYEIEKNEKLLREYGINISKAFSIPFGGIDDFDDNTLIICKEMDYKGILLSRNRFNSGKCKKNNGLIIVERVMAPKTLRATFYFINKICIKGIFR